jgi:rubrerythrin
MKKGNNMKDEFARLIETVKFAIQMELDGKKFYIAAGKQSENGLGKELYAWLATQEDFHRTKFEGIYQSITQKKGLPLEHITLNKTSGIGNIFRKAIKVTGKTLKAQKNELAGVEKAIEMEIKSRDYYKKQAAGSKSDIVRKFLMAVSAEEQGHYLALIDYREYMSDPVDWFTRTEHHLLDGA